VSGRDAEPVPGALLTRLADDPWARATGIEYLDVRRGYARLALTLGPHMLNFQGRPHGGVIFTLADATFGAACNSHGEPAVALSVTINYLASVEPGRRLIAEGREVRQGRRAGFYDITDRAEHEPTVRAEPGATGRADRGTVVAIAHCVAHRVASRPATDG
jgi:acyl-CoA thioesterase